MVVSRRSARAEMDSARTGLRRREFSERRRRPIEVLAHINVQGLQPFSVRLRGPELAAAQQMGQVVDVAAEQRELGGRCAERGEAGAPIGRRDDSGRAVDQAGEIGAARQPGRTGLSARRSATGRVMRTDSLT